MASPPLSVVQASVDEGKWLMIEGDFSKCNGYTGM